MLLLLLLLLYFFILYLTSRPSGTTEAQPSWKFLSKTKIAAITELSSYHGALRSVQAEEKLKQQPGDSHLIRYSDSNRKYILSVLKRGANGPICQHFKIKKLPLPHAYTVEGSDRIFMGASKMLKYFRNNPISYEIDGIGKPNIPTYRNSSDYTHGNIGALPSLTSALRTKVQPQLPPSQQLRTNQGTS